MAKKNKKVTQVAEVQIEESVSQQPDDAMVLKVDHTHAGTKYPAGSLVDDLNPSEATLGFMKEHGIV